MSIASVIQRLSAAKTAIASAITAKGGTVAAGDGFEDFSTAIGSLPSGATLQSKTLTLGAAAPGTVSPDSGYDGLSSVPVSLDTSVITAANIASGVTMLGIAGTHSGGGGSPFSNAVCFEYTPAADTLAASVTLAHNLGSVPDYIYICAKSVMSTAFLQEVGFASGNKAILGMSCVPTGRYSLGSMVYGDVSSSALSHIQSSRTSLQLTSTSIDFNGLSMSSAYFVGGVTYMCIVGNWDD